MVSKNKEVFIISDIAKMLNVQEYKVREIAVKYGIGKKSDWNMYLFNENDVLKLKTKIRGK